MPFQKVAQVLLIPCTLDGIKCINIHNSATGCDDYRIQFYCSVVGTSPALVPPRANVTTLAPSSLLAWKDARGRLPGDGRTAAPSATPTVERTFAPMAEATAVPVTPYGGTAY